ncbi:hypothetical protein WME91_04120 [Sorangium sp. So ce269]
MLRVKHAAVFSNHLSLKWRIAHYVRTRTIEIDFADALLVDHTVMANLHDLEGVLEREGRTLTVAGLEHHGQMSSHPRSARKKIVLAPVADR